MNRPVRDSGFTLVELLVVVAITGLVMPVIAMALSLGFRTTDTTIGRLQDTRDRQIAPSLFTGDVQSATVVDTASNAGCPLGGGTLVLRLSRRETSAAGTVVNRVIVWDTIVSAGSALLERRTCDDTGGSMALVSGVTTTHDVVGAPSVTCALASGATTACNAAATIAAVDLAITDASGTFTVSARRRAAA